MAAAMGSHQGVVMNAPALLRRQSRFLFASVLIVLAFAVRPAAAQTGVIAGKVVNEKAEPFGFVDVSLEPEEGYTYTDSALTEADGTFRFPAVPSGNYKLSAFSDGYKMTQVITNIGVSPGSSQSFTITLVP